MVLKTIRNYSELFKVWISNNFETPRNTSRQLRTAWSLENCTDDLAHRKFTSLKKSAEDPSDHSDHSGHSESKFESNSNLHWRTTLVLPTGKGDELTYSQECLAWKLEHHSRGSAVRWSSRRMDWAFKSIRSRLIRWWTLMSGDYLALLDLFESNHFEFTRISWKLNLLEYLWIWSLKWVWLDSINARRLDNQERSRLNLSEHW